MVKVDVLEEDEGFHTLIIDGKSIRPKITIDYVPQTSVWLVNMNIEYNGFKYNGFEYMYAIEINKNVLVGMAKQIEESINRVEEE